MRGGKEASEDGVGCLTSNNALERARGRSFGEVAEMCGFWINQLRSAPAKPRFAQRGRSAVNERRAYTGPRARKE
jgi:hypothetical protein